MNQRWIYPEEIELLCDTLKAYRNGDVDIDELQAIITQSAQNIVAFEERELREQLIRSEAEIETIRFTVDDESQQSAVLRVVVELESLLGCNDVESGREG